MRLLQGYLVMNQIYHTLVIFSMKVNIYKKTEILLQQMIEASSNDGDLHNSHIDPVINGNMYIYIYIVTNIMNK